LSVSAARGGQVGAGSARQRLAMHAEIIGDLRDRPAGLEHQTHRALLELVGILLGAGIVEASTLPRTEPGFKDPPNPAWLRPCSESAPGEIWPAKAPLYPQASR
jgi:hypothetical protein